MQANRDSLSAYCGCRTKRKSASAMREEMTHNKTPRRRCLGEQWQAAGSRTFPPPSPPVLSPAPDESYSNKRKSMGGATEAHANRRLITAPPSKPRGGNRKLREREKARRATSFARSERYLQAALRCLLRLSSPALGMR